MLIVAVITCSVVSLTVLGLAGALAGCKVAKALEQRDSDLERSFQAGKETGRKYGDEQAAKAADEARRINNELEAMRNGRKAQEDRVGRIRALSRDGLTVWVRQGWDGPELVSEEEVREALRK